MKLKEFFNISLDDIYWRFKLGKSKNRLTTNELRSNLNKYIKNPVFFLSTGRCGTKWFSDLLSHNKSLMILHSPVPNFSVQGKLAFEMQQNKLNKIENQLLKEVFFAGREQYLRYSYKTGKRFIETNNYITFFAQILIELFPDAKFVHLYRHPGEFVRSGIRRNYFTANNRDDIKRITPLSDERWNGLSQLQKTAWLWNETNSFIEKFKTNHPDKCMDFNFNDLRLGNVLKLFEFLDLNISPKLISKSLGFKSNIQKLGSYPVYKDWDENKKIELRKICAVLATKYGYKL